MIAALDALEVITLFVEDLAAARDFYGRVFGREVVYADEVSTVMALGNVMLNLLRADQAGELVAPAAVAAPGGGARLLLTIRVADVDATCAELARAGAALLNGPVDRPWGRRTAAFADPAGNVWEIAAELAAAP